jgi:chromosome segregation ATPase
MSNEPISREAKLLIQLGEMGGELWKARDWVFRLRKHRAIARNFGEQMERERDEARREQSSIQCAFEDSQDKIEELERERDEAREDVKRATYDAAQETIKVSTVKSHWIEACRERDHWKSESLEQAKLLAMSADREERLRSQIAALKSQISNLQSP